jgi:hypothetical protein
VDVRYANDRAEELSKQWKLCPHPECRELMPAFRTVHTKRTCPGYEKTWVGDVRQRFFRNDEQYARDVRRRLPGVDAGYLELVVTAPGVDAGLVWDPAACRVPGDHRCSGDLGCRVKKGAADLWNEKSLRWWSKLHEAAQEATRRAVGRRAFIVFKIPEVHKRGLRHWHLLFGYTSPGERAAADRYLAELRKRAPRYGFGHVLPPRRRRAGSGAGAAYFASYFVSGKGGKLSVAEAVRSPVMKGVSIYVSPRLTKRSGCTMRSLRCKRFLWHRIGPGGLLLAEYLELGPTEVYELYIAGFWGSTLHSMILDGDLSIE